MVFPSLELPERLATLVQSKYSSAKSSGALTFSPTYLAVVYVNDIPFQLRYCPALSRKPTGEQTGIEQRANGKRTQKSTKFDPFENPALELLVAQVPRGQHTHHLVLNKYPVIPQHFILATKEYKDQADLLEEDDLSITYQCLKEWSDDGSNPRLFAFFNSGAHSGASQDHRHIQFLSIGEMGRDDTDKLWKPLIDLVDEHGVNGRVNNPSPLPFIYDSVQIPESVTPQVLLHCYEQLYSSAQRTVDEMSPDLRPPLDDLPSSELGTKKANISYNLAMTTRRMMICPRRSEAAMIPTTKPGAAKQIGPIAVNGTLLAGTLMVKTEEEWDALRGIGGSKSLEDIFGEIGIPHRINDKY